MKINVFLGAGSGDFFFLNEWMNGRERGGGEERERRGGEEEEEDGWCAYEVGMCMMVVFLNGRGWGKMK